MFKLIGNSIVAGCVEVIAEAQTLSEKSGIGAEAIHNFVKGAPGLPFRQIASLIYFVDLQICFLLYRTCQH
jgi:3-hydroxyisobutyrate dehydrogenase-like beta-hydroxyacid dehydrogenase